MLEYVFYIDWHLPSNGTIANVVIRDLDLISWLQMWNNNSSEIAKIRYVTLKEVNLRHHMAPLWIILHDLDLHFQGQTFSYYEFCYKNCKGSGCLRQICLDSLDPAVELLLLTFVFYTLRRLSIFDNADETEMQRWPSHDVRYFW